MDPAIERLAALAHLPDAHIDLARGALLVSALINARVGEADSVGHLESMAAAARERVAAAGSLGERVAALNGLLYQELGFAGNQDDYYDPRNSFLDQVLKRRLGIPISLSVVYLEVGRRAGLPVHGIGFPGHFLVRVGQGREALIVDAFAAGAALSEADLDAHLDRLYGDGALRVSANPSLLRPATHREILVRMLRNLKAVYLHKQDSERALKVLCGILALAPEQPEERRERGLLYRELGHVPAALEDLRRFVALARNAEEIAAAQEVISELEAEKVRLH